MEIIRLNYTYSLVDYNSQNIKKSMMENLITKHFSQLVFSLESVENLNYFSFLIIEMCVLTTDVRFFDKITKILFVLHNEYKLFIQDNERAKLFWNFQKNTIINLFNKLSSTFQSEKLISMNKKIYLFMKAKNDIPLLLLILNIFKVFIINKDYELFLAGNTIYKSNHLPSQVVINFHANKTKKNKKVYENFKSKKLNLYEPYIVFKHNKVFDHLMQLINQDETNTVYKYL